jgi:Capsular polysaccharide synthesis protein
MNKTYETFQDIYEIPKIIWTHWNTDTMPDFIQANLDSWKAKMKPLGWTVNILHDSTIKNYIDAASIPKRLTSLRGPEAKADWLRLKLLSMNGGVWMDAGMIINDPNTLEVMYDRSYVMKSEFTGFKIGNLTTREDFPVIENYFMIAPKGSEVIRLWLQEFESAIEMGFKKHKKVLKKEGVDTQNIYVKHDDYYLTQHACMQAVLQKRINRKPVLFLTKADDSVFGLQNSCGWNTECLHKKLKEIPKSEQPGLVKLRGSDRKGLTDYSLV